MPKAWHPLAAKLVFPIGKLKIYSCQVARGVADHRTGRDDVVGILQTVAPLAMAVTAFRETQRKLKGKVNITYSKSPSYRGDSWN